MAAPVVAKITQGLERFAARSALARWAPVALFAGSLVMTGHLLTLPMASLDEPQLQGGIAELQRVSSPDRWFVLHVMYAECRCSEHVRKHLLARRPLPGVDEWILLVGRDERAEQQLSSHGYRVRTTSQAELKQRYAIGVAPLLVVANPEGWLRYVGGHSQDEQRSTIQDVRVISTLRSGKKVTPLALFACPIGHAQAHKVQSLAVAR